MATKVLMEALSPTMEEGRLVKWNRNEGDAVKRGDVLAEVETDKAVMELVARGDGVLLKRLIAEGDTAPVGSLIGVIGTGGEDIGALLAGTGGAAAAAAAPAPAARAAAPVGGAAGADVKAVPTAAAPVVAPRSSAVAAGAAAHGAAAHGAATAAGGRTIASPLARRLADERGVDLGQVAGSGPGGRIVKRDVESAALAGATPAAPAARRAAGGGAEFEDIPLTQIRKTIARRLAESSGPIPTFFLTAEIDLQRAASLRTAMGEEFKVSFNDIILKATATALAQHPEVNAHWLGDHIRYHRRVHLGVAVATADGLIVPVIFDADRKRMSEISAETKELARLARERKLTPDQYTGATFSVSNLGMFGIDQFTAIINPPEVGILAVGAIEDRAVVDEARTVRIRKRLRVTMSCDHRAVDGAAGAAFLKTLRQMLENPLLLVY